MGTKAWTEREEKPAPPFQHHGLAGLPGWWHSSAPRRLTSLLSESSSVHGTPLGEDSWELLPALLDPARGPLP